MTLSTRTMQEKISHRLQFLISFLLFAIPATSWAQAGPPFQTDDPVPVDYGHYEFYIFGSADGTPAEIDSIGPAFEFNWGALPRLQLHAIVPWGTVNPSNNSVYAPSGTGPSSFGFTDMELGAKVAWIKEGKYNPQIGSFTMFELPTGRYSKGLGVGHVWYKLPLWAYKKIGSWGVDGGAGYAVVPQTGYRNYPYGASLLTDTPLLVKRKITPILASTRHGAKINMRAIKVPRMRWRPGSSTSVAAWRRVTGKLYA
jgi:hypothetical protein